MKHLLLSALLLAGLAGCSKKEDPGPTPEGGIWVMNTHTVVLTPTNGGPTTTQTITLSPNSHMLAFVDGQAFVTVTASASPTGNVLKYNGSYTFNNGVVTISIPGVGYGFSTYNQKSTVLTDHNLTLVATDQTSQGVEMYTDTYTRP